MGEKDFAISTVGTPQVGTISKKPSYLIKLEPSGKGVKLVYFITSDKPEFLPGFVQAKGIYSDLSEEEIVGDFASILAGTPKETFLDMMFPVQKVCSIRSLVFNANKPSTLVK